MTDERFNKLFDKLGEIKSEISTLKKGQQNHGEAIKTLRLEVKDGMALINFAKGMVLTIKVAAIILVPGIIGGMVIIGIEAVKWALG